MIVEIKTYHLEPLLHGGSTLEVGLGGLDVLLDGLLRQINHVGGEEGLAVELEVALVLIEHTVQPGQELLSAVVGVEDDGDTVGGGNATDVVGSGNSTGNGGLLAIVVDTLNQIISHNIQDDWPSPGIDEEFITYLASEVGGTTLGGLQDDRAVLVASSLKSRDDGGGGGNVLIETISNGKP